MQSEGWGGQVGREGQRSPFLSVLDYILLCGRLLEDSTQDYTDGSVKVLRNGRGGGGFDRLEGSEGWSDSRGNSQLKGPE